METSDTANPPLLPRRVIDVRSQGDGVAAVKLREIEDESGQYTTLSHCWGKKRLIKTTTESLERHKDGVTWDMLPKTFQDAITITRWIGIDFIWIDSLCIIQDDREDWAVESAKMANYYGSSALTIAASQSVNSTGGCLNRRKPSDIVVWEPSENDISARQKPFGKIFARVSIDNSGAMEYPLNSRAWTMQEIALARRTVQYFPCEMLFSCRKSQAWESIPGMVDLEADTPWGVLTYAGIGTARFPLPHEALARLWREIVKTYSKRKLTVPTDILPAISGFASRFAVAGMDPYLAGVWGNDLINGLCWSINLKDPDSNRRPAKYRAPSWSWASVEGPVMWQEDWFQYIQPGFLQCSILEASCTLATQNPFGEVASGRLMIAGYFTPVILRQRTGAKATVLVGGKAADGTQRSEAVTELGIIERNGRRFGFIADTSEKITVGKWASRAAKRSWRNFKSDTAYCLQLGNGLPPNGRQSQRMEVSLVLIRSENTPGAYERIGVALTREDDGLFENRRCQITIV